MISTESNLGNILVHTKKVQREEIVLDARVCVLSECPFLRKEAVGGKESYHCGAHIFQADVPVEELDAEVEAHPQPEPRTGDNPFLLRILMNPENTTPYCGLTKITYQEEVLDLSVEQEAEDLFADPF
jgi:hypothetical protein